MEEKIKRDKLETIDFSFLNESQSWIYKETVKTPRCEHRYRVVIRRNVYDTQSYGQVQVWSPPRMEWSTIETWSIQLCECKATSVADKDGGLHLFIRDANKLLALAIRIVERAHLEY